MEDIRPYSSNDEERDQPVADNPVEWEAARFDIDEAEPPFHLPRD